MNSLLGDEGRLLQKKKEIAFLSEQITLPFHSRSWRGVSGVWQGRNQGSSIDFQDHRAYAPGDDPRHLDWAAYARTNHYMMKLFREEVSPRLDVVLDVSESMRITHEKEMRTLELLALVLGAALNDGINIRTYAANSGGRWKFLENPAALGLQSLQQFDTGASRDGRLPLMQIPWRAGSLRVLISDLLFPQSPDAELASLMRENGRAVVMAPYLLSEAQPDWHGNLELHDCETKEVRQQRVEPFGLVRYAKSYRRHFELWQEAARRHSIPLARISCELALGLALRQQALPAGVFNVRH